MATKYSEQDMAKLISEVEDEFKAYLAKAEKSQEQEIVTETKEEATIVATEEVSLNKAESFDYDAEDIEEMNKLYASMSKSEKEAHYTAIKKNLFGDNEPKEEIKKSEVAVVVVDEEKTLLKSENEELKKSLETLSTIVSKIAKKVPSRKAVTQIGNIQVIKKSEEESTDNKETGVDVLKLNKSEINKILSAKIRNGEIKKSEDKEKINKFCYGQIKIDEIKHLL
jgi:hypothetical protein